MYYNNSDNMVDASSISSDSDTDAAERRNQMQGLGSFSYFPAEVEGIVKADNGVKMKSTTPEQENLYTLEPRTRNTHPEFNQGSQTGSPSDSKSHQHSNMSQHSDLTMNESDIVSDACVRPPVSQARERTHHEMHDGHYYPGYSTSSRTSASGGSSMPPPYGYPYGYAQVPPAHYVSQPNTYQRYTFIIVSCLAIISILQMSRNTLSPYAGSQYPAWSGKAGPTNANGGYIAYSPYYYNRGDGQMNMRLNGNRNNNMKGGFGNGGRINNGNNQENQENADSNESETDPTDEALSDEGMEKYPLSELSNFKDNWDEWEPTDVPMFFHIPKAGGSSVKDIMGTCHRFVIASETGIQDGHDKDKKIEVVYPGGIGPKGQDRSPFVNVDTTTVEGIERAKKMGFADSGLADTVVTYFLYEANELFTQTAKGRVFTVFRHPIERAISLFNYIQVADWEPTYDPELKDMTIEEWARSPKIENNWLTRSLSNQPAGDLTQEDLDLAMEVIRRKFMVGLMTKIDETMERFERFFRWTYHVNPQNQEKCRESLLSGGSNKSQSKKSNPQPGSEAWELLTWQNQFDLQLYEYIESLFVEQEQFVADIPVGYRNIDATCCKCDPPTYPPEGFTCPLAILF